MTKTIWAMTAMGLLLSVGLAADPLPSPPGISLKLHADHGKRVVKTYAVGDLVIPPPQVGAARATPPRTLEQELIKSITQSIQPKNWACNGGESQIEYFPARLALVVSAPESTHVEVQRYLSSMRDREDQQVELSGYFLTLNDTSFNSCDFRFTEVDGERRALPLTLSWSAFHERLKALSTDSATNICQLPRLTTLNQQPASVRVGDTQYFVTGLTVQPKDGALKIVPQSVRHELGTMLTIKPTITAGGKDFTLAIDATVREHGCLPVPTHAIQLPIAGNRKTGEIETAGSMSGALNQLIQEPKIVTRSVQTKVNMGNNQVVMLYLGKATIEQLEQQKLPMLDKVPVVAALFSRDHMKPTTNHLVMAIHAKRVVPEETRPAPTKLAELMAQYQSACAQGKKDDARRLAIECLAIDPTCFGVKGR